ncbi:MAG TPA: proline dehydrogenase family protein [Actinomycetota bacterium]|nr:proline dehydrogenase family protein [Actinomycetota bacterium]
MNGPILRAPVLKLTHASWFRRLVTQTPIGRAVASRFIAGDRLDDAIAACRALGAHGLGAVLDHLGENVQAPEHASQATSDYVRALERLAAEPGLDAYISVKLTQLGLDFSNQLCISNLERVLSAAGDRPVMIDMESSVYVDRTLAVFHELTARHERIGVCLQACLRRTPSDIDALPAASIIRLVKGAYLEPPEVALADRKDVDRAFARQFSTLIARGHTVHVATHDPRLLDGARRYVERAGGDSGSRVEYQMLYGVRQDLQSRLAADGLPVRVYVPYGTESYAYLTRRLAERPANMWFFLSNLARVPR